MFYAQNSVCVPKEVLTDADIRKQWNPDYDRKKQGWEARATYEAGSTLMANLINHLPGSECNKQATVLTRSESGEYAACKRKTVGKLSSKTENQLLKCMDKTIGGRVAEEMMMAKTRDGKYFIKIK